MSTKRKIDLSNLIKVTPRHSRARLKRVANAALKSWRAMSSGLPFRHRRPYNAAMRVDINEQRGSVTLRLERTKSKLPRSIEYGFGPGGVGTSGPYDMRTTLLKSSKTKAGKNGLYLAVPIGIKTRKMIGMGGHRAYAMARQLQASVQMQGGNTQWGDRFSNPSGLASKIHKRARHVSGIGHVPAHATDPLASMYRFKGGSRGAKYGTFRMITSHGKPWVHPGIKAHRFIRKLARMMPEIARSVN